MIEWLQNLLNGSTLPLVTAFLLGLLTALSPCPLATNITAIGYIGKECGAARTIFWRGLLYTLGRVITYAGLGLVLIPLLRRGASIFALQKTLATYGELLLPPALILIGLFMLFGGRLHLPSFGYSGGGTRRGGGWGALLLGVLFALAFCPTSGVFYFGMLIPMAAAQSGGYWLPVVFAIATGVPVLIVAWVLAFSVSGLGRFYNRMQVFQKWFSLVVALLFVAVGIYYALIFYF